ncbi:hypothetical protein SSCH_650002 [Syntrophaceticus schinkii]|uniref:Uncharacterized protein n=1 Tax=Syntrophaceticus schinkii TaxID=499207 RepID=A0A0B7MIQ3_9FIRM|nr:hypothetical protein SSCH_650002 [Syntrophaceticus schinkii]
MASYIGNNSEGKTVSMPAIGTGLSRINSSLNVCIRNIVQVFRIVNPPIIGGVQIVIEESSCWKVDMRII